MNKIAMAAAINAALLTQAFSQTDMQDTYHGPSLRTVIPLAVTTLLIGSSTADVSELPSFTSTCNQVLAPSLIPLAGNNPQKGDYPLNVTQMTSNGVGQTQTYRNCTVAGVYTPANYVLLFCCQGISNVVSFLQRATYVCIGGFYTSCQGTNNPQEIACKIQSPYECY